MGRGAAAQRGDGRADQPLPRRHLVRLRRQVTGSRRRAGGGDQPAAGYGSPNAAAHRRYRRDDQGRRDRSARPSHAVQTLVPAPGFPAPGGKDLLASPGRLLVLVCCLPMARRERVNRHRPGLD